MTERWNYHDLAQSLGAMTDQLWDMANHLDNDESSESAMLARDASDAVRALYVIVKARAQREVRQDERKAAIVAVLCAGETVETFKAEAVRSEVERRQLQRTSAG